MFRRRTRMAQMYLAVFAPLHPMKFLDHLLSLGGFTMKRLPSPLERLVRWYQSNCDGDWEHQHGVRLATLDNPGWSLDVDLEDTPKTGSVLPRRLTERSDTDWVQVEVKDNVFRVRGGSGNLAEMIDLFARFLDGTLPTGARD